MSQLIFLPSSRATARALRENGEAGPWLGYTPSPDLQAALDDTSADALEYAALNLAGIAELVDPSATDPLRLVLAAEVPNERVHDRDAAEPGAATVDPLAWSQVIALFADDPEAAAAVGAARSAVGGRNVPEAIAAVEVARLLERHDLGWYAPEELDDLP